MMHNSIYLVLAFATALLFVVALDGCAPAREFTEGVGKTIDKLVHPREW